MNPPGITPGGFAVSRAPDTDRPRWRAISVFTRVFDAPSARLRAVFDAL
jgi:hypothetical protein